MKSVFDKLNLRPAERRLVIIVMIVVFIVLNFIFVWPHFGDWGKIKARRTVAENLVRQYEREIGNTKLYQAQLKELGEQGATVQTEAQALTLSTEVQNQAALSGVQVNRYDPIRQTVNIGGKTNQFFEEQGGTINVTTEEKSLVDFLYNLGMGKSLIRVKGFTLNPDPPRHKLQGNLTLVASYQKKAPTKVVPAAATPPPTVRSTNAPGRSASPFPAAPTNAAVKPKAPVAATATKTNQSVLDRMKGWFK